MERQAESDAARTECEETHPPGEGTGARPDRTPRRALVPQATNNDTLSARLEAAEKCRTCTPQPSEQVPAEVLASEDGSGWGELCGVRH